MNKEKVFIEGHVVGSFADTLGTKGKQIQIASGDIVDIDDKFIYKSIEPQKVKVKQFVADWYEEHKDEFEYNVWDWLSSKSESGKIDSKFAFWLNDVDNTPIQTLVNMHQFGYEVDEEKRYLVKIKASNQYIMSNPDENAIFFYSCRAYYKLTSKELEEAGFGWVFDCPGIEIEEVE